MLVVLNSYTKEQEDVLLSTVKDRLKFTGYDAYVITPGQYQTSSERKEEILTAICNYHSRLGIEPMYGSGTEMQDAIRHLILKGLEGILDYDFTIASYLHRYDGKTIFLTNQGPINTVRPVLEEAKTHDLDRNPKFDIIKFYRFLYHFYYVTCQLKGSFGLSRYLGSIRASLIRNVYKVFLQVNPCKDIEEREREEILSRYESIIDFKNRLTYSKHVIGDIVNRFLDKNNQIITRTNVLNGYRTVHAKDFTQQGYSKISDKVLKLASGNDIERSKIRTALID